MRPAAAAGDPDRGAAHAVGTLCCGEQHVLAGAAQPVALGVGEGELLGDGLENLAGPGRDYAPCGGRLAQVLDRLRSHAALVALARKVRARHGVRSVLVVYGLTVTQLHLT